jgi:hypothetical protein
MSDYFEHVERELRGVVRSRAHLPWHVRWRPRRSRALAVVFACLVLSGAAVAAQQFSAHSGIFLTRSSPNARALGTGEALAMGAPDAVSVGVQETKDIPFAPGYQSWRARDVAFQLSLGPGAPPAGHAFMTVNALRWQVADAAACSWMNDWLASSARGDTSAARTAGSELEAAPSWRAITAMNEPTGLDTIAIAVSHGDTQLVRALIDTGRAGNCSAVGPFPPTRLTTNQTRATLSLAQAKGARILARDPLATQLGITSP